MTFFAFIYLFVSSSIHNSAGCRQLYRHDFNRLSSQHDYPDDRMPMLIDNKPRRPAWMPTHFDEVELTLSPRGSTYIPIEIMPGKYYVEQRRVEHAGLKFNPKVAPLRLLPLQETLEKVLYSEMIDERKDTSTQVAISERPDGLANVGLLFLVELKVKLLASVIPGTRKAIVDFNDKVPDWEWKFTVNSDDQRIIEVYLGNDQEKFFKLIEQEVLQEASKIMGSVKKDIQMLIQKAGIQLDTRIRFDVACPSLLIKKMGKNQELTAHRTNDWKARVVLMTMLPIVPQKITRMQQEEETSIIRRSLEERRYSGGMAVGWTSWKALMLHGRRPLNTAVTETDLDRMTKVLINSYLREPVLRPRVT